MSFKFLESQLFGVGRGDFKAITSICFVLLEGAWQQMFLVHVDRT